MDTFKHEGVNYINVKLLGLKPGLKVFELDKETLEIREAEIKRVMEKGGKTHFMIPVKKTCRYEAAINLQNAHRKFVNKLK